ncbi:hypothetical protein V8J88_04845 [Massilia sp. W12]|uniref:hypothetical protein n=1 Tax=Massilia sp. W12 TaxID=3126507 RepID=UPI0030CB1161
MNTLSQEQENHADMRNPDLMPPVLVLTELNPANIIEGVMRDDGFQTEDEIQTCGAMRETCPYCEDQHLLLVLRQRSVKVAHLFCPQCTRCYHASYQDGSPALALI